MDVAKEAIESLQTEFKNGAQFMTRCTKPDKKGKNLVAPHTHTPAHSALSEYLQICRAVATGFVIMGGIGYVVKLVHIPINNILVGGS
ncbi:BQ2448_3597 [Microbotryum intermedium]|uniref:BQ2448_3597 protein n=1 Tax=Microbotryum intermedium TaxID=269621 RepID=A0A238FCA5_9BASI|nr:BQ2448_3597 [Microbotryum intermedium]